VRFIYPLGNFYSPIINNDEVKQDERRIWPEKPVILGLDFNEANHEEMLKTDLPGFQGMFDYKDEAHERRSETEYYCRNGQFPRVDATLLFTILQILKPRRFIEIGSGFSSLLVGDVNRRIFQNKMEVYCIEPFPSAWLANGVPGITQLIKEKVQTVPLSVFELLNDGDILFIDSSHVAKTGSDVNHLYFEIIPRIAKGVFIHVHDIFLPHDYPKNWVIDEGRGWNEAYVLRALLMYTSGFRVLFGNQFAAARYPDQMKALYRDQFNHGSSFWMEKIV
jgi:hypothetical protein